MRAVIEFGFDLVTRTAGAPTMFSAGILRQRIAALDHEAFHNAMKSRAVIKAFLGKGLEVLHRLGRDIRPELHHHFTRRRFDHSHFVRIAHDRIGLRLDYLMESAGTTLMLSTP